VLHEVVARIDSLDSLMKDILLFARPPRPRPSPIDVVSLIEATASLVRQDPAMHGIEVEIVGMAPPLPADAEMLRIVLHNLLVNGAHAMQGRGRISVAVDAAPDDCRIAVSDGGPGIPTEIRSKLFRPFVTTKSRGTGLGLATAKRLVEAHDGRITVDCPPEGGTIVTIRLPIHGAEGLGPS
jgi:two-component system sensor histidine kinase PilS (NtrC family)